MKPLVTCQKMLTWLCAYPDDSTASASRKSVCKIITLCIFILNLCALASSVAFVLKFMRIDFKESLYSFMQIAGSSNTTITMIIAFFSHFAISGLFESLSKIYEKSEKLTSLTQSVIC